MFKSIQTWRGYMGVGQRQKDRMTREGDSDLHTHTWWGAV